MSNKKHEIKTFEDIVNCTNIDNVDAFIADLKGMLTSIYMVRSVQELHTSEPFNVPKSFTWIDDGEHNINMTLKPT